MISFAEALPIGNAIRILLAPADTAVRWRLLRKTVNTFSGWNDSAAGVIYDGSDEVSVTDVTALTNGTPYYYCEFETVDGTTWTASPVVSVTPATTYGLGGPDPLSFLRDRLEAGLRAAVQAGVLKHPTGAIPTLTAPSMREQDKFPVVSVHLAGDSPGLRGIGEDIGEDVSDGTDWTESEGWLSDWRIQIIGWSLNPDERIALRKAIKNIVIGNLPIFDSVGMVMVSLNQSDIETPSDEFNSVLYQVVSEFSCMAPSVVSDQVPVSVTDVEIISGVI